MAGYTPSESILARLNAYGISRRVVLSERQATLLLNFLDTDPHNRRMRNPCGYDHNQIAYRSLLHLLDFVDERDMLDIKTTTHLTSIPTFLVAELFRLQASGWIIWSVPSTCIKITVRKSVFGFIVN
jgi:hypothetical protein